MSTPTTAPAVDPIVVEIVQGTLASVEMEVETAIARAKFIFRVGARARYANHQAQGKTQTDQTKPAHHT